MAAPTHQVFVSHAAEDKAVADQVVAALECAGFRCWIAPRDIVTGESWANSILQAIAASKLMVLIFSSHTGMSPHVKREIERAVHRNIPIAPLRTEDVMPEGELEYFLSSQHWADLFPGPVDQHVKQMPSKIGVLLGVAPKPASRSNPWTDDGDDLAAQAPLPPKRHATAAPASTQAVVSPVPPPAPAKSRRLWPVLLLLVLGVLAIGGILAHRQGWLDAPPARPVMTEGRDAKPTDAGPADPKAAPTEATGAGAESKKPDEPVAGKSPATLPADRTADSKEPTEPAVKPAVVEPVTLPRTPEQRLRDAFADNRLTPEEFRLGQRLLATAATGLGEFDRRRQAAFAAFLADDAQSSALLGKTLEQIDTDEQAKLARIEADKKAAADRAAATDRRNRVEKLLAGAATADTPQKAEAALAQVEEALKLDPGNARALTLRDRLTALSVPREITNSIGMKLVRIEPGTFQMGSPATEKDRADDEIQHTVRLTRPFFIGTTEVTQGQWKAVMGTTLRQQRDLASKDSGLYGEGDDYPMYYVSWEEAVAFCEKLSRKEGKRYRLPTEAEWEYACRAGSKSAYCFGDNPSLLDAWGWFGDNSGSARIDSRQIWETDQANYADRLIKNGCQTRGVGRKRPNDLGLYDMHGNVWEWCSDWYGPYGDGPATDPTGAKEGSGRVLRGGSWFSNARGCRSSARNDLAPDLRDDNVGFRLSLDSP